MGADYVPDFLAAVRVPEVIPMRPDLGARSPEWDKVRRAHLKTQPVCQICLTKVALDVHHIVPFHVKPAKELDPLNLVTLCVHCHFVWGHGRNWLNWNGRIRSDCKRAQKMIASVRTSSRP